MSQIVLPTSMLWQSSFQQAWLSRLWKVLGVIDSISLLSIIEFLVSWPHWVCDFSWRASGQSQSIRKDWKNWRLCDLINPSKEQQLCVLLETQDVEDIDCMQHDQKQSETINVEICRKFDSIHKFCLKASIFLSSHRLTRYRAKPLYSPNAIQKSPKTQ